MGLVWWLTLIIPATQQEGIRRIVVWGQPRQKGNRIPSQQKHWCILAITVLLGEKIGGFWFKVDPGKNT
jgi:hypothetical protein